jgi:hypothetical protein
MAVDENAIAAHPSPGRSSDRLGKVQETSWWGQIQSHLVPQPLPRLVPSVPSTSISFRPQTPRFSPRSWLGLAGGRVCQGPSYFDVAAFLPSDSALPPCASTTPRNTPSPRLRETRDTSYPESRVERFPRNLIRDRHRHSTYIQCNKPGIALDRTATSSAIRESRAPPRPTKATP